jgi:DNA-directed RNA polymerase specialized sigma24 family protein
MLFAAVDCRVGTKSGVHVVTQELLREESALTQFAFSRLLEWLDDGVDSGGARYVEIRQRLVSYFDRRNRPFADDLADETLTRIGRTLEREGTIAVTPPARYCYVVARFVLLEDLRRERRHSAFDDRRGAGPHLAVRPHGEDGDAAAQERRLGCLERCLQELKPDQRQLAVDYYGGAGGDKIRRRRALADRLGITMNALAVRVHRIRAALQTCVDACGGGRRVTVFHPGGPTRPTG